MASATKGSPTPGFTVDRSKGVGASEVAAVVGLGGYSHAVEVWERKTGRAKESADTHHTLRGTFLEDGLLRWLAHELGDEVRSTRDPETGLQRTWVGTPSIVYATPDGLVYDDTGEPYANADVKSPARTARRWFSEDGSLIVPDEYVAQLAWQAHAMGSAAVDPVQVDRYVSGAMLDYELRYKVLARDRELESYLVEEVERWWRDHVVADKPPLVDGSEASTRFLERFFPESVGKKPTVANELPKHEVERLRVLVQLADEWRAREKQAAEQLSVFKNQIKQELGERAGVEEKGVWKATWTNNKASEAVDWKAACEELLRDTPAKAAAELLMRHTYRRPGPRVLRLTWKGGQS